MWLRQAVGRISRKSSRSGENDLNALLIGTPIAKTAQGKRLVWVKSPKLAENNDKLNCLTVF
jgi:hypothetical protein